MHLDKSPSVVTCVSSSITLKEIPGSCLQSCCCQGNRASSECSCSKSQCPSYWFFWLVDTHESLSKKVNFFICIHCTNISVTWVQAEYCICLPVETLLMERGNTMSEDGLFHPTSTQRADGTKGPLYSTFLWALQRPTELEYLFRITRHSIFHEGIVIVYEMGKFNMSRLSN